MPKLQGPKSPKSKKLPRKLPNDPVSRAVDIATDQQVCDTADKITRAPKKKR